MPLTFARRRLVVVLAIAALGGLGWPAKRDANSRATAGSVFQGKQVPATGVDRNSRSLVLRSTHIILIQLISSRAGQWITDQIGNPKRTVQLSARLEEILKGTVQQARGSEVRIKVDQTGRPGTRYYALPGVWSDQPIDPGTRLIAFSSSTSNSAADLLVGPSCIRILLADEYLLDVRLAMKAEAEQLPLPALLMLAKPWVASLNYVFAEYVTSKFDDSLLQDVNSFRLLMSFIENPALATVARSTLLTSVHSKLIAFDPAPIPYVQALTVTMFHLAVLPQASALHDNLLKVFLPNLLGLSGGGTSKKKAQEVFGGVPEERQRAERILQEHRGEAAADALMRWLRE